MKKLLFIVLIFVLSFLLIYILNYPKIELVGNSDVIVNVFDEYIDSGYKMNKRFLSIGKVTTISDVNTKVIGDYKITYLINYFGKKIYKYRNVKVIDNDKPIINLVDDDVIIFLSGSYVEPGFTATDNYDGDITDKVIVENNIESIPGNYEVTYTVKDSSGNEEVVKRNVTRKNSNKGIVYLTFDDGPSNSTSQILDILDKYDVKATFFVINFSSAYNDIIKKMYDSGHTVALHTSSHVYKTIYSSVEDYYTDLNAISDKVYSITGNKSMIIRFPGGSSNTISSFNKGIMSTLTKMVNSDGYHYFDWNVDSNDAGSARTSDDVYNNVISGVKEGRINVVLMHDFANNNKTIGALDKIIKRLIEEGYEIKPITMDTPVIHHGVNN